MLPDKLTPCPSPNLQGTFGGRKPTFGRAAVPKPGGMLPFTPKVERSQAELDAYEQRLVEECESMSRTTQRDTSKVRWPFAASRCEAHAPSACSGLASTAVRTS